LGKKIARQGAAANIRSTERILRDALMPATGKTAETLAKFL
jgi:hypothetical protein